MTQEQITDQIAFSLDLLGERTKYHYTCKNYTTQDVKNGFVSKDQLISLLTTLNLTGYTCWVSINNKETDSVEGVTELNVFWNDIDSRPKGVTDRPATKEEKEQALKRAEKFKHYIESQYAAIGFIADSGNGFHVWFPLPTYVLVPEMRKQVNDKMRAFAIMCSSQVGADIDKTYDISRRATLIGLKNNKLHNQPLKTGWHETYLSQGYTAAKQLTQHARTTNANLLNEILNTATPKEERLKEFTTTNTNHIDIETLLNTNEKFRDLYKDGNKEKYNYTDRSTPEMSLVTTLILEGFNDCEINTIMMSCALGKWQNDTEHYRKFTIEKARIKAGKTIAEKKQLDEVWNKEKTKQLLSGIPVTENNDDKPVNPIDIAEQIMKKYTFVTDAFDTKSRPLWIYDPKKGIYSNDIENIIKDEIVPILGKEYRAHYYTDIEDYIHHHPTTKPVKLNQHPELIGTKNCIVNIRTKETIKFEDAKNIYVTSSIQWTYNPDADCPKIKKFLKEILDPDQQLVMQEWSGFLLYRDYEHKSILITKGAKDTGKTLHQNINIALIGQNNNTGVTMQQITSSRFHTAELYGKLGNLADDMPTSLIENTGTLKKTSGRGIITGEKKGKDPFDFVNYAKHWFTCNQLPKLKTEEDYNATWGRIILMIYQYPKTHCKNTKLQTELITDEEMSGYLNYAIEGFQRLDRNGKFSSHTDEKTVRAEWVRDSDVAKYLIEKYVEMTDDEDAIISHSEFFARMVTLWRKESRIYKFSHMPSAPELLKTMRIVKSYIQNDYRYRLEKNSNPVWCYRFIKINDAVPEPKQSTLSINTGYNSETSNSVSNVSENYLYVAKNKEEKNLVVVEGCGKVERCGEKHDTSDTKESSSSVHDKIMVFTRIQTDELCHDCKKVKLEFKVKIDSRTVWSQCPVCFEETKRRHQGYRFVEMSNDEFRLAVEAG